MTPKVFTPGACHSLLADKCPRLQEDFPCPQPALEWPLGLPWLSTLYQPGLFGPCREGWLIVPDTEGPSSRLLVGLH